MHSTDEDPTLITYLEGRIYLAFFDGHPSSRGHQHNKGSLSPKKGVTNFLTSKLGKDCVYFNLDHELYYNSFHADFGPFHYGCLYRFAVRLHEVLVDEKNSSKPVVYYTSTDSKSRTNAAFMIAAYMVLVQNWPPHLALAPLFSSIEPFLTFRDAGYAAADYGITIQDVVYGLWRAKEAKLVDVQTFNLDEYERYERVENGDFNWIGPKFIAFASPIQRGYSSSKSFNRDDNMEINGSFQSVLDYFETHDVGMIVRLNKQLYSKDEFLKRGIKHLEMYFEDGTVPEMADVRKFIEICESVFEENKVVAVHCKAGLGRTGCLIGAYLIYKYAYTANEVIGFMRFLRPGMVVGPQQHWLHLNQHTFRGWSHTGLLARKTLSRTADMLTTPPRAPLSAIDNSNAAVKDTPLPAPTPGQPRKSSPNGATYTKRPRCEQNEAYEHNGVTPSRRVVSHSVSANTRRGSPQRNNGNKNRSVSMGMAIEAGREFQARIARE